MRLRAHRCFLLSGGDVAKKLAATKHWKMGLKDWVCRHKLGVLVMIILVLELVHYLLTASWLPWQF